MEVVELTLSATMSATNDMTSDYYISLSISSVHL